jgi:hypothetical protein
MSTISSESSEEAGSPQGPQRRRRVLPVAAAVLVVAAAVIVFLLVRDDDDDSGGSTPTTNSSSEATLPPPVSAPLDAEAEVLADLIAEAREATFHAVYKATGDAVGGELTLEVWRKDGRIRQDSTLVGSTGTGYTAGILDDDQAITCSKQDEAEWVCSETADATETNPDGIFGAVIEQLAGADVTESTETIDGREARCFSFPTGDGTGSMCLTDEGIPLRLTINETNLVLETLEDDVEDDVFTPPAEPVQESAPTTEG